MKRSWLLIVAVIVGFVGLGYFILSKGVISNKLGKNEAKSNTQSEKVTIKIGEVEKTVIKNEIWETVKWDNENGKLRLKNKDDKEKEIVIDLQKMKVLLPFNVNNLKHEKTAMQALDRSKTMTWQTAFCPGDEVSLGISEEDEVVVVMNLGYRLCGFKGE